MSESDKLPDLLGCPFCGDAPTVLDDDSYGHCIISCNCELEPAVLRSTAHKSDAIAAWNRRSPSPGFRDGLEAAAKVAEAAGGPPELAKLDDWHDAFFCGINAAVSAIRAIQPKEESDD